MLHSLYIFVLERRLRLLESAGSRDPRGIVFAILFFLLAVIGSAQADERVGGRRGSPDAALSKDARAAISAALGRDNAQYRVRESGGALEMFNARQRLSAVFSQNGVEVHSGTARFGLSVESFGRGPSRSSLPTVVPVASANRVEYRRAGITEWYVNGPAGLEQGFTVWDRPTGESTTPLSVSLAMSANVPALVDGARAGLTVGPLRYSGLLTVDATGRELPSWIEVQGRTLIVQVDDADARYPITIDPLFEQVKLSASDGVVADHFGLAVAISADGNTIVAGAESADIGSNQSQGAVYVFVKPASGWATATQTAKLTASDGAASDLLGESVAISGDTIVAGARNANGDKGAAYVFVKPGTGWANGTETAKLTASDGITNENFGLRVAIGADTIAVAIGQPIISRTGRVYVFVKPANGWANATETAQLSVASPSLFDLNHSVPAVTPDGNMIVAGSPNTPTTGAQDYRGAVYIFLKPASGWANGTQTAKLTVSDSSALDGLGDSVAISGNTIAVGALHLGNGNPSNPGAVYVFVQPSGGWGNGTETAKLTASDGVFLGFPVAIGGNTVAAGAPFAAFDSHTQQGTVYLFTKPVGGWIDATETTKVSAFDGVEFLGFGGALAMSGEKIVVGTLPTSSAVRGVVYVLSPVAEKVDDLISLISGLGIPSGAGQSFKSKLDAVKKAIAAGDIETACSLLNAFINEVTAQQGKKKLTGAQAAQLISEATEIKTLLGCV
jgi:hypothetical protein